MKHTHKHSGSRAENWQGMNWIRQEKRLAIYIRDGFACAYCGAAVEDGAALTLDHVIPVDKGGKNAATNLVTACVKCNCSKNARNVVDFCKAVAAYVNHGLTSLEIHKHVIKCCAAVLPMDEAKAMIAHRGSAAKVVAARLS